MPVSMDVGVSGDAGGKLAKLIAKVKDLAPALDEMGASNVLETQMRFEGERDPEGKPWAALSALTLERRGSTAKILRDQGNLYDSVTHVVSAASVRVGTNRRYARIHQLGGQAGRGKKVTIPARPFLGVSEDGLKELVAILTDHVEGT